MRKPLAVGDRAIAYSSGVSEKGTVVDVTDLILIRRDRHPGEDKQVNYWYHPKQCRKLSPKKRAVKVEAGGDAVALLGEARGALSQCCCTELEYTLTRIDAFLQTNGGVE